MLRAYSPTANAFDEKRLSDARIVDQKETVLKEKRRDESLRRAGKLFLSTNYAAASSSTAAM
jgi:hypothetical protein